MRLRDISLVQSGRHATVADVERTASAGDAWYQQRPAADQLVILALCGELREATKTPHWPSFQPHPDNPNFCHICGNPSVNHGTAESNHCPPALYCPPAPLSADQNRGFYAGIFTSPVSPRDIVAVDPIPMRLTCPMPTCAELHVDEGVFATKPHHTHSCQKCGHTWRPAVVPTVGVRFLPGFKNEE